MSPDAVAARSAAGWRCAGRIAARGAIIRVRTRRRACATVVAAASDERATTSARGGQRVREVRSTEGAVSPTVGQRAARPRHSACTGPGHRSHSLADAPLQIERACRTQGGGVTWPAIFASLSSRASARFRAGLRRGLGRTAVTGSSGFTAVERTLRTDVAVARSHDEVEATGRSRRGEARQRRARARLELPTDGRNRPSPSTPMTRVRPFGKSDVEVLATPAGPHPR